MAIYLPKTALNAEWWLIKQIKGRSSRQLRDEYPPLRTRIPTLWTNSYFIATVGGAPLEIVKQYVENQKNV